MYLANIDTKENRELRGTAYINFRSNILEIRIDNMSKIGVILRFDSAINSETMVSI